MKFSNQLFINYFFDPASALRMDLSQWSQFIFILRECDVLARFHYLSTEANCFEQFPEKVKHHLNSASVKAERQAKQAMYEALDLTKNLGDINITPIFLKGVAYSLRKSSASFGRVYADMDVLVPKSELRNIEQRLSFYGWFSNKSDEYDQKYYRQWAHEIPPMQHSLRGTVADIHHNLIPPISGRAPNISIFTEQLFETKEKLYTLSKPAMVMHSIIHLFFNEEFNHGFRDISDLHMLFSEENEQSSFWTELINLSKKAGFEIELYYAVRHCRKIAKTHFPIPFLALVEIPKLSAIRLFFADFIFNRVLLPSHPACNSLLSNTAHIIATLRGHLLKMPLHILIYHSTHKLIRSCSTMFDKKDSTSQKINMN